MNDPRHNEEPLARWAGNVLGQLPHRTAPRGLAPLILAAVARQRSVPWYRRPWRLWPGSARMLSATLVGGSFAALWWFLLPQADTVSASAAQAAAAQWEVVRPWAALSTLVSAVGKALLLVARGLNPWVLVALGGLLALLWSTTLGLGTACWRMAAGHPSER